MKSIMNAKQILLIATGKDKAHAVKMMLQDSVSPAVPATILRMHPNVIVLLDKDAASEL